MNIEEHICESVYHSVLDFVCKTVRNPVYNLFLIYDPVSNSVNQNLLVRRCEEYEY